MPNATELEHNRTELREQRIIDNQIERAAKVCTKIVKRPGTIRMSTYLGSREYLNHQLWPLNMPEAKIIRRDKPEGPTFTVCWLGPNGNNELTFRGKTNRRAVTAAGPTVFYRRTVWAPGATGPFEETVYEHGKLSRNGSPWYPIDIRGWTDSEGPKLHELQKSLESIHRRH